MTHEDTTKFLAATECHICEEKFATMDISEATLETGVPLNELPLKCRDHCHFSGNFLGAAHQSCNLNRRFKWNTFQVPVYAHNFTGYDSHLIIKELCVDNHEEISALAANTEKFKMIKF